MEEVIRIDDLTKTFGDFVSVSEVNLQVQKGSVFGFLGPNGAGKTTTIRLMLDIIRPTSGQIRIFGLDSRTDSLEIRRRVGYLAGDMEIDKDLTGEQYLQFIMHLHARDMTKNVQELTARLQANTSKKIRELSRGNRQKIGLIAALMSDPDLLILDEPTSGLDPLIQAEFHDIISQHRARGGTVFLSSHVLSEVQQVCDEVAFIREGKILAINRMDELVQGALRQVSIRFAGNQKQLTKQLRTIGAKIMKITDDELHCHFGGEMDELIRCLAKFDIADLHIQDADLDAVFLGYYQKGVQHA